MVLVMSDLVLDGTPVATCQLSQSDTVHVSSVHSQNGESLDETELRDCENF
jgi:hypothetical protein